jgi:DNA repair exonuclease SbcCD nuclease subunit
LQNIISVLDNIFSYALQKDIKHVFFLGDLFHHRTLLYSIVYEKIVSSIEAATNSGLIIHCVTGNHDLIYNNDQSPSIIKTIKSLDVINSPTLFLLKDLNTRIGTMKWYFDTDLLQSDLMELNEKLKLSANRSNSSLSTNTYDHLLLGHFELSGVTVNDEYILKNALPVSIFKDTLFNLVMSGHVHKQQTLDNVVYVGVPIQHRFTDENSPFGFFVVDLTKNKPQLEYIPTKQLLPELPKFTTVHLTSQEDVKSLLSNKPLLSNYLRIYSDVPDLKLDTLFKKIKNYVYEDTCMKYLSTKETADDPLNFHLDLNHYLQIFFKQESDARDLSWMDQEKINQYMEIIKDKGKLCQE